jgi:hypothetical protein
MTRTDIINYLINKNNFTHYLEIGLDNPYSNFHHIKCSTKLSVDPYFKEDHDQFDIKLTSELDELMSIYLTHKMTSDEFFAQNVMKFDLIFIDGLHTKEQVARDIYNSLCVLKPHGKIVVHDCLPLCKEHQLIPRCMQNWTGDVWKAIPELKLQNIVYHTVDTDWGCCIINYFEGIPKLITQFNYNWDDYVDNKFELMNIIDEKTFLNLY